MSNCVALMCTLIIVGAIMESVGKAGSDVSSTVKTLVIIALLIAIANDIWRALKESK